MWWLFLLLLTGWNLWATIRRGRRFALGSTVLLSLLIPCWVKSTVAGLPFDLRIAVRCDRSEHLLPSSSHSLAGTNRLRGPGLACLDGSPCSFGLRKRGLSLDDVAAGLW